MKVQFRTPKTRKVFIVTSLIMISCIILDFMFIIFKSMGTAGDIVFSTVIFVAMPLSVLSWLLSLYAFIPENPRNANAVRFVSGSLSFLLLVFITILVRFPANYAEFRRCSNRVPYANLHDCDYKGFDFEGLNLTGANLSGVDLNNVNLKDATLNATDLDWANLSGANLSSAKLDDATLFRTNLNGANLTNASLKNSNLEYSFLVGTILTDAILDNANLNGADAHNAVGLTDDMLSKIKSWYGLLIEDRQTIVMQAEAICSGKTLTSSGSYESNKHFHPIVIFNQTDTNPTWSNNNQVGLWMPSQSQLIELVACITESEKLVDQCTWKSKDGSRTMTQKFYQRTSTILLLEAKSGNIVLRKTLEGSYPKTNCSQEIPSGASPIDKSGDGVKQEDIRNVLIKYVNPDGEIKPLTISK